MTLPNPIQREAIAMTALDTTITTSAYRDAMARLASAVHLVTTDGPDGRAGFTASAVCSVSDAPPTLLVCLNRSSSAYAAFSGSTSLCVNTLAAGQRTVADAFGGKTPMAERFAAAHWTAGTTGAPILAGALVSFDCRIVSRMSVATHDVLFCEVVALADSLPNDALVYTNRRYYTVPDDRADLPMPGVVERVEGRGNGWTAKTRRAALRLA